MEENKNELKVKFHNNLNSIKTTQLTEIDLNVFFALCAKAKGRNETDIDIDFDTFFRLCGLENNSFVNTRKKKIDFIDKKSDALSNLQMKRKTDSSLIKFPLITELRVDEDEDLIKLSLNKIFLYILNTDEDFTKFILADFVGISGKYAKNLYRLLMRYDDTGWADYTLEDFKDFMGIPAGYRPKDIITKIIKPSIEELVNKGLMTEVRYEPKTSHRQGNGIKGFHFDFKICVNDDIPGQTEMNEVKKEMVRYKEQKARERLSQFNNFPQNTYDFDEFEKQMLDN